MKKIILISTAFILLTTTASARSPALYPSYAAAAKDAKGDILPSFEQIGFIGKVAFEKIKPSVKDIPAGESNFLEQVFLPAPSTVLKDLTMKGSFSFNDTYKRRFEEAFHSKIEFPHADSPAKMAGTLKIEPVPSYYLQVGDAFGGLERAMKKATPVTRKMREFFYAMHAQALHDLGIRRRTDKLPPADEFISNWKTMPEMNMDARAIIPLGPADPANPSSGTKYWAVLGVEPMAIEIEHRLYTLLVPVSVEVVIQGAKPMANEEFRAICDKYKTKKAIVSALKLMP